MSKRIFNKPALTVDQQISFLKNQKKLCIVDEDRARFILTYVGYYRLKIYMRSFESDTCFEGRRIFLDHCNFDDIVKLYNFDRDLRLLCFSAIERIEVSLRAHLVNLSASIGNPHFYSDVSVYENGKGYVTASQMAATDNHLSIKHYSREYCDPVIPPIWCLTEASTFGHLSKIYASLRKEYRKTIADSYGLDEQICVSWFKTLTTLRNICAHHERFWNAQLLVNTPKKAKRYASYLSKNDTPYARLCLLKILLDIVDPDHEWDLKLKLCIESRPSYAYLDNMGMPDDWQQTTLWDRV